MSVIFLLIGASLLVAVLFLGAFAWSVNSGQYEDTDSPAIRMLVDKKPEKEEEETKSDASDEK